MTAIRTIWQCGNAPISTLSNLCAVQSKCAQGLSTQRVQSLCVCWYVLLSVCGTRAKRMAHPVSSLCVSPRHIDIDKWSMLKSLASPSATPHKDTSSLCVCVCVCVAIVYDNWSVTHLSIFKIIMQESIYSKSSGIIRNAAELGK